MTKFQFGLLSTLLAVLAVPANADELTQKADSIFSQRTETTGGLEALRLYEQAVAVDSTSITALWKAARACHWLADHAALKKEKLALFEKGIGYGEKAVALDPKSVEGHFWLGALYGSYGETKGVLKSLALVKPIRREMHAINRLNDRFQGGAGYRVLGIVDYKVPGFAGGSKRRALEQLNKALAIDPSNAFNQYYIAEYFQTVGDKKQAREHLKILAALSVNDDVDAPDLKTLQAKGEKLRRQIGT